MSDTHTTAPQTLSRTQQRALDHIDRHGELSDGNPERIYLATIRALARKGLVDLHTIASAEAPWTRRGRGRVRYHLHWAATAGTGHVTHTNDTYPVHIRQ